MSVRQEQKAATRRRLLGHAERRLGDGPSIDRPAPRAGRGRYGAPAGAHGSCRLHRRARGSVPPAPRRGAVATHILTAAEVDIHAGRVRPIPAHLLFNTWLGLVHHYVANRDLFAATGPGGGASPGDPDQSPNCAVMAAHGPTLVEHYINLLSP